MTDREKIMNYVVEERYLAQSEEARLGERVRWLADEAEKAKDDLGRLYTVRSLADQCIEEYSKINEHRQREEAFNRVLKLLNEEEK